MRVGTTRPAGPLRIPPPSRGSRSDGSDDPGATNRNRANKIRVRYKFKQVEGKITEDLFDVSLTNRSGDLLMIKKGNGIEDLCNVLLDAVNQVAFEKLRAPGRPDKERPVLYKWVCPVHADFAVWTKSAVAQLRHKSCGRMLVSTGKETIE